jgi:hypothetical protein
MDRVRIHDGYEKFAYPSTSLYQDHGNKGKPRNVKSKISFDNHHIKNILPTQTTVGPNKQLHFSVSFSRLPDYEL